MNEEDNKLVDRIERALLEGSITERHELFPLIGKHVVEVHVNPEHDEMRFTLDDGNVFLVGCDGDCCSHSWFESVNDADDLHDASVAYIVEKDIVWPGCDGDEEKVYGYTIATSKGFVDLVFRNSSNGYYGGMLTKPSGKGTRCTIPVRGDWRAS